ncbi:MAG: iron-sulfur cluster-binding domain-containing protein [Leptospiraceae bacterium]|nr:iron-sulfur cluster-binding domain-containing protein [Leptospiraceae bacterium]
MKTLFFQHNTPTEYFKYFAESDLIDFMIGHFNPMFSRKRVRASILKITKETEDTKTLVLNVNRNWKKFQAGQHIPVTVEIEGRRVTRFYSISSSEMEAYPSITVKKQAGGVVSNFIHDHLKKRDMIEIGEASGNFCLKTFDENLLFIVGGSGITPVYSILKTHLSKLKDKKITLIYFSRTKEEIIFFEQLNSLEDKFSNLKIHHVLTHEEKAGFRTSFLSKDLLETLVPDYQDRLTFLCGPETLQNVTKELIHSNRLISENFQPHIKPKQKKSNQAYEVKLLNSHKSILVKGEKSLLQELEDNGVYPPSGCRMGICHTCICTKTKGSTEDMRDGDSSTNPKSIQICVSRAESNLELEL